MYHDNGETENSRGEIKAAKDHVLTFDRTEHKGKTEHLKEPQ